MAVYKIPKEPIETFVLRYPEFRRKILYDPPEIYGYIKKWNEICWTTVSVHYPKEWTDHTCIREYIQNAMDASEEKIGKPWVEVGFYPELGTFVRDRGPGITQLAVIMGGVEKPKHMRGYFGEGLKMSAGYLLSLYDTPTYFFRYDGWVMKAINLGGLIAFVFGRARLYPTEGTEVIIPGWEAPYKGVAIEPWRREKAIYTVLLNGMVDPFNTEKKRPARIIADAGNRLYVGDIFVNYMDVIGPRYSLYTWDLWWVKLHRGRTAPEEFKFLTREVGRVLRSIKKANVLAKYLERILEYVGGVIRLKREAVESFEADRSMWALRKLAKDALRILFRIDPKKLVKARDELTLKEALIYGYIPIFTGNMRLGFRDLFELIPFFERKRSDESKEIDKELIFTREEELDFKEKQSLFYIRGLNWFFSDWFFIPLPEIKSVENLTEISIRKAGRETRGRASKTEIELDRGILPIWSDTVETFGHEWAHVYCRNKYGWLELEDYTKHVGDYYWRALEAVMRLALEEPVTFYILEGCAIVGVPFISKEEYKFFKSPYWGMSELLAYDLPTTPDELERWSSEKWSSFVLAEDRWGRHWLQGIVSFKEFNLEKSLYLTPTEYNLEQDRKIDEWIPTLSDFLRGIDAERAVLVKFDRAASKYLVWKIDVKTLIEEKKLVYL